MDANKDTKFTGGYSEYNHRVPDRTCYTANGSVPIIVGSGGTFDVFNWDSLGVPDDIIAQVVSDKKDVQPLGRLGIPVDLSQLRFDT